MGTTFIFWVTAPENIRHNLDSLNKQLKQIESGLIEFFGPIANSALLPNPPNKQNPLFCRVCEEFESLIQVNRENDYSGLELFDFIHSRLGGH
jgi:hypothetical protein